MTHNLNAHLSDSSFIADNRKAHNKPYWQAFYAQWQGGIVAVDQ